MKRRKTLSELLGQDDILEAVLTFLDLATLCRSSVVCKSWRSIISNPSFRRRWCQNSGEKESLRVMTTSLDGNHCAWDPLQANHIEKFAMPPQGVYVIASAGGLVCIATSHDLSKDVLHLLVANPVTHEWSALPELHSGDVEIRPPGGVINASMFVDKVGFKVGLHFTGPDSSGHWCYIYDSAKRAWSSLPKLPFSPTYIKMREQWNIDRRFPDMDDFFYDLSILGLYDFGRTTWITGEVVRSLRITTGLEGTVEQDEEILRCVLPRPGWCAARLWEHNGQRYFASGWVNAGGFHDFWGGIDGYGVWKVDDKGGLVTVSAVHYKAICDQAGKDHYNSTYFCSTHAEGNLVTFSQTGFVCVYNLSTGRWGGVGTTKGVIYRPSFRTL